MNSASGVRTTCAKLSRRACWLTKRIAADSAAALWPCVRYACISSEKQRGILTYKSVPRELFFIDALRAAQMHQEDGELDPEAVSCDKGSASRLTYKMRGHAWANPMRFNVSTSADSDGSYGSARTHNVEGQQMRMAGGAGLPASLLPSAY